MPSRSSRGFRKPRGPYTQAHRLLGLYDRLARGESLNAGRLAEEVGLSKRTLERDLGVLKEVLGDELEWGEVPDPGWRLRELRRRWDTDKWQVLAVAVGARMTGFLSGKRFSTHVSPLLTAMKRSMKGMRGYSVSQLEKKIHVIEGGQKLYRENPELQKRLTAMVDGLLYDRAVDISYLSPKRRRQGKEGRELRVHVLCMALYRGSAYFVVQILAGERGNLPGQILLNLDRLQRAKVDMDAEAMEPPKSFRAEKFFESAFGIWGGDGAHRVHLTIDADYEDAVRERFWHETQEIGRTRDGRLSIRMKLGRLEEVADWILGMGEHAYVNGPRELRELVRGRLKDASAQYE